VAVALAKQLATASVVGTDISASAVAVAKGNVEQHKVTDRVTLLEGDLYAPLARVAAPTLFHVIAANPPYIPTAEVEKLPATVREHEPRLALDGGTDGLAFHRRIIAGARQFLAPGGLLIMEMQFDQGPALHGALAAAGHFGNVRTIRDAGGHPRCVVGTLG
jgi:release factor glutamine methyltransferase